MIKLFAFVPRIKRKWLRRIAMVLVALPSLVEGALNGIIDYTYGYRFWWSYDYPTETTNV